MKKLNVSEFKKLGEKLINDREKLYKVWEKELTKELLENADIVVVTTAHTNVDYDFVQQNAKVVFDTKNAMKNVASRDNVELL